MSWTLPLVTLGALGFFGALRIAYNKWDWGSDGFSLGGLVVTIILGLVLNGLVPVRTVCLTPQIDRIITDDDGVTYVYVWKQEVDFYTTLDVNVVKEPEKYKLWMQRSYSSLGLPIDDEPITRLIKRQGG